MNLAYEFFGIVMPGLVALVVWTGTMLSFVVAAQYLTWSEASSYYAQIYKQGFVALGALVLISYMVGHLLMWFSREGLSGLRGKVRPSGQGNPPDQKIKNQALRFLLLLGVRGEKDFDPALSPLRDACANRLAGDNASVRDALSRWRPFYLLATHSIEQAGVTSLVAVYRNKYTLHRSLATAFAVGVWTALILAMTAPLQCERCHCLTLLLLLLPQAVIDLLLVLVFSASYKNYWQLLGDTAVAEAYLLTKSPKASHEVRQ